MAEFAEAIVVVLISAAVGALVGAGLGLLITLIVDGITAHNAEKRKDKGTNEK